MYESLKHIGINEILQMSEIAIAYISILCVRLAMLKKRQGHAIPLFFNYVIRTHKTNLNAAQLRSSG